MRIDKFLTECGIGSRSQVKKILTSGLIKVNDVVIKNPQFSVFEEKDRVEYKDKILTYKKFRYYIMNKKSGYVTAREDINDKTVMELLPDWVIQKDLSPVGRLDKDTEGLLLFTNDGKLAHSLLSPKKHVDKTYYVQTLKDISQEDIEKLEAGVDIGGYITKQSKCKKISEKEIELTISEGKFHQIKKMLEAVENKVIYLKRISFGNLKLGDLKLGETREIDLKDIL